MYPPPPNTCKKKKQKKNTTRINQKQCLGKKLGFGNEDSKQTGIAIPIYTDRRRLFSCGCLLFFANIDWISKRKHFEIKNPNERMFHVFHWDISASQQKQTPSVCNAKEQTGHKAWRDRQFLRRPSCCSYHLPHWKTECRPGTAGLLFHSAAASLSLASQCHILVGPELELFSCFGWWAETTKENNCLHLHRSRHGHRSVNSPTYPEKKPDLSQGS